MQWAGYLFVALGVGLLMAAMPMSRRFRFPGSRRDQEGAWLINLLGMLDDDVSRWYRLLVAVVTGLAFIAAGLAVAAGWWDITASALRVL